ncbi:magnesium transporter [Paenibacillus mesophilus]|uniref:magnesium transporter CorA family protein n=1 Tax=Paenibacillus mesophilus TaxID=2582849 RepID=UPI00110D444A|nr:magnesium transporter CorA family protein [Paenibacillus mesophilus]TMV45157.1 magnesium transporter [Paenibacillus mesophilus]
MNDYTHDEASAPKWRWIRIRSGQAATEMADYDSETADWLRSVSERTANLIVVSEKANGEAVLYGTLAHSGGEEPDGAAAIHFHATAARLVTLMPASFAYGRLDESPWRERLARCTGGHEAFAVLLGFLAQRFHAGLDGYEARLGSLEAAMRSRNRKVLMDRILERRHELIEWSLRLAPFRELGDALNEAFMDDIADRPEYRRLILQLERIERLLGTYEDGIDTLLSMDDAVSSFRGNEIMKTLTIFTALFTPATVIGALWGMNFEKLPLAGWPSGFAACCAAILLITALIYVWLWRKGWTGDLLRGRSRDSRL